MSQKREIELCGEQTFLTCGADGAIAYGTEASPMTGSYRYEGYSVDTVDTTGAGDGFWMGQ
ncbi:hypothetical protein G6M89_16140 [Natronolimnobius sp. AArcel1]|uniref:PfkB family carbohydrate kinase n=1 Tax=Natronolimnobius sp. AArcel1 TaxID=1679093 RepID=UPI0013ED980F|nr:hypothetical protein [Natronolimnobius sp. AArcel1]